MIKDFEAYSQETFKGFRSDVEPLFFKSLLYSFFSGGKRFRPRFIFALGQDLKISPKKLFPAALALELIHTYSLIHDDLPAMDDDMYRRGKLTHHSKYGEASAVLAGDALQALAFQVLAEAYSGDVLKALVLSLSKCSGLQGMVGGQVLDCLTDKRDFEIFQKIHLLKTAKLFDFCARSVGIIGEVSAYKVKNFSDLGLQAGLLFQLQDDLLDEDKTDERPEENILHSIGKADLLKTIEHKKVDLLKRVKELDLGAGSSFLSLMEQVFSRSH